MTNSMSSGCAAMAMAEFSATTRNPRAKHTMESIFRSDLVIVVTSLRRRRLVRRENDFVRLHRIIETRERHFLVLVERVEEGLELRRVGMVRHVAGIEHLHGEIAPRVLVQAAELLRMEFVVEQAAVAADEVRVEIVRLKAINHCGAFADAAVS